MPLGLSGAWPSTWRLTRLFKTIVFVNADHRRSVLASTSRFQPSHFRRRGTGQRRRLRHTGHVTGAIMHRRGHAVPVVSVMSADLVDLVVRAVLVEIGGAGRFLEVVLPVAGHVEAPVLLTHGVPAMAVLPALRSPRSKVFSRLTPHTCRTRPWHWRSCSHGRCGSRPVITVRVAVAIGAGPVVIPPLIDDSAEAIEAGIAAADWQRPNAGCWAGMQVKQRSWLPCAQKKSGQPEGSRGAQGVDRQKHWP